jgi:hypothetical protein
MMKSMTKMLVAMIFSVWAAAHVRRATRGPSSW